MPPLPVLMLGLMLGLVPVQAIKFRSLSCPNYCQNIIDPVCGEDGKIYRNDCEMRKINCGDDVESVGWETCRFNSGLSTCQHHCDKELDMVCGTDGHSYVNHCYLMVEHCMRGVELSHYGPCSNGTEVCPENCSGAERDGPICGSDGNVYTDSCHMAKATCGQGVVAADRRHCQTTKHCDDKCFRISKISCGSDGKLYNNGCQMMRKNCGKHVYEVPAQMMRKNCGKHVYEVPAPYCLNKLYRTKCPVDCRDAVSKPVCGSDGQLYANRCELEKMTCGFPLTRYEKIVKVPLKMCLDKIQSCSRMTCPRKEVTVCGNDGVSYRNLCELQEATCRAGVQLAHSGPCVDLAVTPECPTDCTKTPLSVVCASDGNSYPSLCHMQKQTCGQRVQVADLQSCQTTRYCNSNCTEEPTKFLCGSDGSLHRNECEMRKTHCGKHVYKVPMSKCLSVFQWSGCGRVCPPNLDPVCGTDNKTYLNACFLQQEDCRARSIGGVTRKHYGQCGEPARPEARNYIYK